MGKSGSGEARDLALRAHPLLFGTVVFLASELMLFTGLLAGYYDLRHISTQWPPPDVHLDTVEITIGTVLLGLSSGTMLLTTHAFARLRYAAARLWLGVTIAFGIAFLVISVHGWMGDTFDIGSHAYGSIYYTMTGFHVLHVSAGILLMAGLFAGIRMRAFSRDERAGAEAISYYWHFVFIVWVLIWGSIYVIK